MKRYILPFILLAGIATALRAQPNVPAPTTTPAYDAGAFLAPFIDTQHLAVGYVDVAKLNTADCEKYLLNIFDSLKLPDDKTYRDPITTQRAAIDTVLARFKQLGGRRIFLLLHHDDLESLLAGQFPLTLLLPVEPGGNPKDLAALFPETPTLKASVLRNDTVFYGDAKHLKHLEANLFAKRSAAQPFFTTIADDAPPVQLIARVTPDDRRVIADLMPRLPAELGGGSTEFLSRDLDTLTLSANFPPTPRAVLSIKLLTGAGNGNDSGKDLLALALKARDALIASHWIERQVPEPSAKPMSEWLKDLLTPERRSGGGALGGAEIRNDQITYQLGDAQIKRLIQIAFVDSHGPAIGDFMDIIRACDQYMKKHNNTFPESLDLLVKENLLRPEQLLDKTDPKHRPYGFHPWKPEQLTTLLPVLWEPQDDTTHGGYVGVMILPLGYTFRWVESKAALDALIKEEEERAAKNAAGKK